MRKRKFTIQKVFALGLFLAFVLAAIPFDGIAQDDPTLYAVVDHMKVKPGDEGKYLELEKNFWKPMHQERVNKGKIIGWVIYKVRYTGSDDPYNFVTVTIFDNPENLENPWDFESENPMNDEKSSKAFAATLKSRELVKSSLVRRVDAIYPEEGPGNFKFLQIAYMKVKQGNDQMYINVEQKVWKPVHNEFIKSGTRVGWSLWAVQFPGGYGNEFQYVTVNYFDKFSKIGSANYSEAFGLAHSGKDVDGMFNKTSKSRVLVKSELWEKLDIVWKE